MFRSTSELRVRLAPLNWFKPSSKIFYWPFQGGTSFVDLLCFCSVLCLLCFVRVCLYVLCGHLLGKGWPLGSRLWCLLWVCHFPIGILGQVWYLIVSIPDLCNLIILKTRTYHFESSSLWWKSEKKDWAVFYHLQRKVQTNEFQEDANIRAVLDYFMGLTQRKNKRLVSLDKLVSLEARTL